MRVVEVGVKNFKNFESTSNIVPKPMAGGEGVVYWYCIGMVQVASYSKTHLLSSVCLLVLRCASANFVGD